MAIKTYNDQNFVAIANAIRAKNGETTQYKPSEMAPAIMAIESGLELLPQDTAAGAIANFPDGSNNYPVVELIANIDPKQAGSGDPSPSNVRPISGSTECKVVKHGKNFINVTTQTATINGVTFTVNLDGTITCNGTATALTVGKIVPNGSPIRFYSGKKYTLSGCPAGGSEQTFQLDLRLTNSTGPFYSNVKDFGNGFTWLDSIGGYAYPIILIRSGYTCNNLTFRPQIEISDSATDYEPYQAETKTIDLGRTVYGGSLNVTTGELTVTRKSVTFNGSSSENWGYNAVTQGNLFRITNQGNAIINANNTLCNSFKPTNARTDFTISGSAVGYMDFIHNSIIGDTPVELIAAWRNYLAENNIQVVFSLTTPEVYQLEPEIVKTLLGVNNIYADTGDVEVTYRADIDLYIAKKIAEGA